MINKSETNLKIVVIGGCGWLGNYINLSFNSTHFSVLNGTRKPKNTNDFYFNIKDLEQLPEYDFAIFCIPPSKYSIDELNNLKDFLEPNKPVLYTSSTAVYSEKFKVCTEDLELLLDDSFNEQIFLTEQFFVKNFNFSCILRLAGLVGDNRNPARFLSGKSNVQNGKGPVNLVHGEDVAMIIKACIENNLNGIFNVCCDDHPTRKEFYTRACEKAGLPLPHFIDNLVSNKTIDNSKIKQKLNYEFLYPSPYNMI